MQNRLVVLGNLPLATKIIRLIRNEPNVELVGVVTPPEEKHYPSSDGEICAARLVREQGIPRINLDETTNSLNLDLAISARNNTILPPAFLDCFRLGVVNCHGGYIPDYKGVGGHIFPIVNGESHSGATLHWMTEEIDAGDIIDRHSVSILPTDTGVSLFKKINDALYVLIEKNLQLILDETAPRIPQCALTTTTKTGQSYYKYNKDINRLVSLQQKTDAMRRALVWPGK